MSNVLLALLCIVASLLLYFYYKVKKIYETWSNRGIPHEKPVFFFGNSLRTVFRYTSIGERLKEVCDQFPDAPFIGFYEFLRPQLLVKDSEIIEKILIKDFQHFVDHGFELDENKNPLDISLFNMTGKRWKAFRNKLTPIFTTGKLKILFEQMNGIAENMDKLFDKENMKGVELRDVMGRFAMDVISSFAFGFDAGNLLNPDSEFRRMGKKSFELSSLQLLRFLVLTAFPDLSKKLGLGITQSDVQDYFVKIIRDTIDYRKKNNARRNDFVDLMIQIKEKGSVEITTKDPGDDYLGIEESYVTDSFDLTDELIIGTAFVFLTAGFEATATSMTWACFEISQNDEIQDRLHNEIVQKVKEHGGLNFNAVKDMDYLEMTLKETLRKYPPAQLLFRVCTKEYSLPGGQTIKAGESVQIPLLSVHHSPEYYPEPSKFDPERFAPDASLKPCVFLPFGDGPRVCIAMRFAMQQIKFGLAKILLSYRVKLNSKTKLPVTFDKKVFFTAPNDPIYFDLTKI